MAIDSFVRLRRLRRTPALRALVQETVLNPSQLIQPMFVAEGGNARRPLAAIPGTDLLSGDAIDDEAKRIADVGLKSVLLFGVLGSERKDPLASSSSEPNNPVCYAIDRIKTCQPEIAIIADLCLCEYTSHGHCGVLENGRISNDLTLNQLGMAAVNLARAGADVIAPSGVMDGVVLTLRKFLDSAGYQNVALMPYSAKFASCFYGPFKSASQSVPSESQHSTHQISIGNQREALRKIEIDVQEGADMVIVKPALTSLDILALAKENQCSVPLAGYDVSGFYSMIMNACDGDTAKSDAMILEILTIIRRAGAQMIITYHAKQVASILR
ncbi:MAG: porphobilinogen synthase [Pirellulales bacterium]